MFETVNNNQNLYFIIRKNKILLNTISLHDFILSKYALVLGYYPMIKSKFDIFIKLDKRKKVGMLNRHILSAASKLGVYQTILKEIVVLRENNKRYKKFTIEEAASNSSIMSYFKKNDNINYWQNAYNKNQIELKKMYTMLLDIMCEELQKRNNSKYLRKIKLQEIKNNYSE